jgi:hypothetical protein
MPAVLGVSLHLLNNRSRHQDWFYSITCPTRWYANLEFIGSPGFDPTFEDWKKGDPYKPRVAGYSEWAFHLHSPWQYLKETLFGFGRCAGMFWFQNYFSRGLPPALKWLLMGFYAAGGIILLLDPDKRWVPLSLLLWVFPYAFVSHVFMAPRFYMPFSPLVLAIVAAAVHDTFQRAANRFGGRPISGKTAQV